MKGTYCPPGSSNSTLCPPGYVCGPGTEVPEPCPSHHYCPIGTWDPIKCDRGTYCPNGTAYPIMCPLGYKAVDETNFTLGLLGDFATACEPCAPGEYGTDPARLNCEICAPGYVCEGATSSSTPTDPDLDNGYVCPTGIKKSAYIAAL